MKIIQRLKEKLDQSDLESKRKILGELIEILRTEGKRFAPRNFIWKLLNRDCLREVPIRNESENKADPSEISPVLVSSILNHGQLLPIFVTSDGRIIDGKARYTILGDKVEYIVLSHLFCEKLIFHTRILARERDTLIKIAEKKSKRRIFKESETGDSKKDLIWKAMEKIAEDLSLPQKVEMYVLLKELEFWKKVKDEIERKISEIENLIEMEMESVCL